MNVYHVSLKEAQADLRALSVAGGSPFERLDWLAMLADQCLAPATAQISIATSDTSTVLLPWRDTGGHIESLANWYNFFVRPTGDPALLPALARNLPYGRLTFAPMPEDDATEFASALRNVGWIVLAEPCDSNHILAVEGRSFAEYWAQRPGALRETVRRKGKKGGVSLRIVTDFTDADWTAYESVYKLSWKPGEGSPDFLRKWAQMDAATGRLRLGIAEIAGRPVAAQFWTVEGGTAFIHKLAHDENYRKQSPGTLLTAALFEHVIDSDRVALVDFGTGDDAYKRDWMEQVRTRWRIRAWRPQAARHWPSLVRAVARKLVQPLVSRKRDA